MENRKSNVELLRIVAMLMIIGLHFFGYANAASVYDGVQSANFYFWKIAESFCIGGVNIFVLISGWFLTNKDSVNIRKIVDLIIQVAFWSGIGFLLMCLFGISPFNIKTMIKVMLPYFFGMRWFVTAYIIYFLFIPFLNAGLSALGKKSHRILLFICGFLFCVWPSFLPNPPLDDYGYGFVHFIFLYILISYIRKYFVCLPDRKICLLLFVLFSGVVAWSSIENLGMAWAYNYLFVVLASLFLFLFFVQFNFYNKTVNILASCSFGVFIIHTDGFFSRIVYGWIFQLPDTLEFSLPVYIAAFLCCLPLFYLIGAAEKTAVQRDNRQVYRQYPFSKLESDSRKS